MRNLWKNSGEKYKNSLHTRTSNFAMACIRHRIQKITMYVRPIWLQPLEENYNISWSIFVLSRCIMSTNEQSQMAANWENIILCVRLRMMLGAQFHFLLRKLILFRRIGNEIRLWHWVKYDSQLVVCIDANDIRRHWDIDGEHNTEQAHVSQYSRLHNCKSQKWVSLNRRCPVAVLTLNHVGSCVMCSWLNHIRCEHLCAITISQYSFFCCVLYVSNSFSNKKKKYQRDVYFNWRMRIFAWFPISLLGIDKLYNEFRNKMVR